jgi:hypothetical protein
MAMAIAEAGYPLHVSSDERDDKLLPTFRFAYPLNYAIFGNKPYNIHAK